MASKGKDVWIAYKSGNYYIPFGGSKNCDFSITRDMKEVSSINTGDAKEYIPGRYNWTMSLKCIIKGTSPRKIAINAMLNRTLLNVKWVDGESGENYAGTAYISDIGESAQLHDIVTVSIKLKGTGALTYYEPSN